MSHDFVHMRIDDLGTKLWIIRQVQEQMRAQMGLLYNRVFEYMEEGQTSAAEKRISEARTQAALKRAASAEERAAASEGRAAAAEERAAAADKRAAAAEQAATQLE